MKTSLVRLFLLWILFGMSSSANAATWYVAPDGNSSNAGTRISPLDIVSAFANESGKILPGDTLVLQRGIYKVSQVRSTLNNVRVDGLGATIDFADVGAGSYLHITGSNSEYVGFEITNSSTASRITTSSTSWPEDQVARGTVAVYESNVLASLIIHDIEGMEMSNHDGGRIVDCLIYNVGWVGSNRRHGHGLYLQNRDTVKEIERNVIFGSFGTDMHIFTEKGFIQNFRIVNNTIFNGGGRSQGYTDDVREVLIGGSTPASGIVFANNRIVQTGTTVTVDFGYTWGADNKDAHLESNYIIGQVRKLKAWETFTQVNNTLMTKPSGSASYVEPAEYIQGRGYITVFNWNKWSSMTVTPSSILKPGDKYEIRSVLALIGPPVLSGTYQGGKLNIPMRSMSTPKALGHTGSIVVGPEFNVFLVTSSPPIVRVSN